MAWGWVKVGPGSLEIFGMCVRLMWWIISRPVWEDFRHMNVIIIWNGFQSTFLSMSKEVPISSWVSVSIKVINETIKLAIFSSLLLSNTVVRIEEDSTIFIEIQMYRVMLISCCRNSLSCLVVGGLSIEGIEEEVLTPI